MSVCEGCKIGESTISGFRCKVDNNTFCNAPHEIEPYLDFILFKLGTIPLFLLLFHTIYCFTVLLRKYKLNEIYSIFDFRIRSLLAFGFITRIISSLTDPWGDRFYYPIDIIRVVMFRIIQVVYLLLCFKIILEWHSFMKEFHAESISNKVTRYFLNFYSNTASLLIVFCDIFNKTLNLYIIFTSISICFILGGYFCIKLLKRLNTSICDETQIRKSSTLINIERRIKVQLRSIFFAIVITISILCIWLYVHFTSARELYYASMLVYFSEFIIGYMYTFYIFPFTHKLKKRKDYPKQKYNRFFCNKFYKRILSITFFTSRFFQPYCYYVGSCFVNI